jgi:hypothetical protein
MADDEQVSTVGGCALLLLLYFASALVIGVVIGLAAVGALWLAGWL